MLALARPLLIAMLLAMLGLMVAATASRTRTIRDRHAGQAHAQKAATPKPQSAFADPAPAGEASVAAAAETAHPATAAASSRPAARPNPGFRLVRVRAGRAVRIHSSAGGRPIGKIGSTTEFGSAEVLTVAKRRSHWLGVTTSALPNGKLAWIDGRSRSLRAAATRWSLRADLSRHRLELRYGKRVVRRIAVAIGRPGSTTPTGRFQVTDKLAGSRYGAYYGCCILALSGHQPHTPAGWTGGSRLAIHGTDVAATIGTAASAGCLRAADSDLRALMRKVPLGTPVFIRA